MSDGLMTWFPRYMEKRIDRDEGANSMVKAFFYISTRFGLL